MSEVAVQPLSDAERIFKEIVLMPMLKAGENWLETAVPALDLPILKQIDETVIEAVANAIFNVIVLYIDVEAIKLKNQAHQTAYEAASLHLMVVAAESGIDSEEFKKERDAELIELQKFVRIGP